MVTDDLDKIYEWLRMNAATLRLQAANGNAYAENVIDAYNKHYQKRSPRSKVQEQNLINAIEVYKRAGPHEGPFFDTGLGNDIDDEASDHFCDITWRGLFISVILAGILWWGAVAIYKVHEVHARYMKNLNAYMENKEIPCEK